MAQELTRPEIPPPVKIAPTENKILGIPEKNFVRAQAALTEAASNEEVVKLTAEIERLINLRDDLMFAVALKLNPDQKSNIETIAAAIKEKTTSRVMSGP